MQVKDMTGLRMGMLVVLSRNGSTRTKQAAWLCRCDCGTEKTISGAELRNAGQRSCGCITRECAAASRRTHGQSRTALHRLWRNMINRCERPATHNFHRYGGRGITVCSEWRANAAAFITWCQSNGYASHLELDRRDNERGYSPDNCRFVTRAENAANRSPSSRKSRRNSSARISTRKAETR